MGCCSGRSNNDGNVAYSKENATTIVNEINNKGDLKLRHKAGWRTHHIIKEENKDEINFLTLVIENHPDALKDEGILTISEESLKGTGKHGKNYEYILSSPDLIEVLSKNYKDEYGVPIKMSKAADAQKNVYELLKKAFEIGEKKADATPAAVTNNAPAETKPEGQNPPAENS